MEYVALDFETANNEAGGACAIGLMRFDEEGRETDRFYSLLCPKVPYFDPWMSMVHKLPPSECLAAPTFDAAWPKIREFLGDDLVVAHFAQFDMGVLRKALGVYGLDVPPIRYVCTCNLGRKVWPHLPCYKLSYLTQYLDMDDYRQHNALDDAMMCGRLMYRECVPHLLDEEDFSRYLNGKSYRVKKLVPLS